ncbi:MAG: hypothetical protein M0Z59_08635 [Nitrospiraceae bacterium]|nr:hypothetical protein [Nitrospiraceae bacterium]
MKRKEYTEVICKSHCDRYKPEDRPKCGAYEFLSRNLTAGELAGIKTGKKPAMEMDGAIRALACDKCRFLSGCGYRSGQGGKNPCGGYKVMERLLSR